MCSSALNAIFFLEKYVYLGEKISFPWEETFKLKIKHFWGTVVLQWAILSIKLCVLPFYRRYLKHCFQRGWKEKDDMPKATHLIHSIHSGIHLILHSAILKSRHSCRQCFSRIFNLTPPKGCACLARVFINIVAAGQTWNKPRQEFKLFRSLKSWNTCLFFSWPWLGEIQRFIDIAFDFAVVPTLTPA